MKKTARAAFATLFITSSAMGQPLMKLKEFGGLCSHRCPESMLIVEESGKVIYERLIFHPKERTSTTLLLTLSDKSIKNLKKKLRLLSEEPLVDQNERNPICVDNTQKVYSVVTEEKSYIIGNLRECHMFGYQEQKEKEIVGILNALSLIAKTTLL